MAKTPGPGARQFCIVILVAAAAAFAVLGIERIRHFLDYLQAVNSRSGQDIMRGVQQKATLIYWLFWSALAAVPWSGEEFIDTVHFAAQGSRKFAETIAPDLRRICN